jgi:Domain of unknown function (DUF4349)
MTTPDRDTTLATIDRALESGTSGIADPDLRSLEELALALRAQAPAPDRGFAASLNERVAAGFPRQRRRLRLRPPRVPRPKLAALGVAASALVALVVAVSLDRGGGDDRADTAPAARDGGPSQLQAPERASGGGASPAEPPTPGGGIPPSDRTRRIERSASVTLAAPSDRLDAVADNIVAVVDRRRGYVLRSSISSGDEGATGGSFDLRVPAGELRQTLRELSQLADVRARSQSGQDITRGFVSVEDRLRAARAERRGLLRRLERADSDREAQAIRDRLNLVSGEIRGLRDQLRDLRERTSYAAVAVTLVQRDGNDDSSGGASTGDAFDDALGSLVGSFNIALRVLGVAVPLALVAALAWLAAAALRRRRREAALG